MRRQDDARYANQWMIQTYRLTGIDIDCRPGYDALFHSLSQVFFGDNAAAGAVHKTDTLFHLLHLCHADHTLGIRRQWHMYGDEVRFLDDIIQCSHSHTESFCSFFINIWVIRNDIHIEGHRPLGYTGTDTSHTDDAQRLAPKLYTDILLAVPLALLHGLIGDWNVTGHGEHHGHRMLGCCDRIAARGVDDDNAFGCSSRNIDIVNAYAGTTDDLKVLCPLDHFSRYLRCRAHHQCIVLRNDFQQFLCRQFILDIHVEFFLQEFNTFWGNTICSQNLHNSSLL